VAAKRGLLQLSNPLHPKSLDPFSALWMEEDEPLKGK